MTRPRCLAALAVLALLVAACGGAPEPSATEPSPPHEAVAPLDRPPPTMPAQAGTDGPKVVAFEVPADVSCSGGSAPVTVGYETQGASGVSILVDQEAAETGDPPPLAGEVEVVLECDGATHAVLLVAASQQGVTYASAVVRTEPSG